MICPINKSDARKEKELFAKLALLDEERVVKYQTWKIIK
jgi:hypothetical protein